MEDAAQEEATPQLSSIDEITISGGRTRREAPASGLRPTVRFAIAFALTFAWVAFSVWVSEPWRGELEAAIGPVMGWVIPLFLAYTPPSSSGS